MKLVPQRRGRAATSSTRPTTAHEAFEFDRTVSRLIEMQSRDWLDGWAERRTGRIAGARGRRRPRGRVAAEAAVTRRPLQTVDVHDERLGIVSAEPRANS